MGDRQCQGGDRANTRDPFAEWRDGATRFTINIFEENVSPQNTQQWYSQRMQEIGEKIGRLRPAPTDVWVECMEDEGAERHNLNLYDVIPTEAVQTTLKRLIVTVPVAADALQTAYVLTELTDLSLYLIPSMMDSLSRWSMGWETLGHKLVNLSLRIGPQAEQAALIQGLPRFIRLSALTLTTLQLWLPWCWHGNRELQAFPSLLDILGDQAYPALKSLRIRVDRLYNFLESQRGVSDGDAETYTRRMLQNRTQTLRQIVVDLSRCTTKCWAQAETTGVRVMTDVDLPPDTVIRWLKPGGAVLCIVGRT